MTVPHPVGLLPAALDHLSGVVLLALPAARPTGSGGGRTIGAAAPGGERVEAVEGVPAPVVIRKV